MLASIVVAAVVVHSAAPAMLGRERAMVRQTTKPSAQPKVEEPWPPAGVTRPGNGTTTPRVILEPKPGYTADAMKAGIQGGVLLEAVVEADGSVSKVRVKRSLDKEFGLDDESVKTLKKWRFVPGQRDGKSVPVLVEIEMTFSLRQ